MAICVTFDLSVKHDKMDEFLEAVAAAAPDTRAYAGCRSFDIWLDQDKPGHVLFYEIWDSREHQEKYLTWRTETGVIAALGEMLATPPVISYYDRFDG